MSTLRTIGHNRETVLRNDDLALETEGAIASSKTGTGSSEYCSCLQGAARLLTRRCDYAEPLKVLNLIDPDKLGESWRGFRQPARDKTLAAAGRNDLLLFYAGAAHLHPTRNSRYRVEMRLTSFSLKIWFDAAVGQPASR